jgi:D-alanine-D-alanine ligase
MSLRVAILYDPAATLDHGAPEDLLAAQDVRRVAEAVAAACRARGWAAESLGVPAAPRQLLERLERTRPHVAFNLVEGLRGDSRLEAAFAALLELVGLPYTGSPPRALALGLEKPLVRDLLRGHGLPVPPGRLLRHGDEPLDGLRFPCIVKPAREDASHGITTDSVVADAAAARRRGQWVRQRYRQAALVEEFVDGREFNVSILGSGAEAEALPIAEIDFEGFPAGRPRLVTYAAKWVPSSPEYRGSTSVPARALPPAAAARLAAVALDAYRAVGLRDYGRVDLRLCPERGPLLLDVNPNPDLSPDAGLARAADRAGLPYADLVGGIVEGALARGYAAAPPHGG